MDKCEFAQPNIDHSKPSCNRSAVLSEIFNQQNLEGMYTLAQLPQLICNCTNGHGVPLDCPAYDDLKKNGRRSRYSK
jgi:hypothetical protein